MKQMAQLCLVSAFILTSTVQADEFPKRKAGLWEIKTSIAGINQELPSASQCIDASTDEAMQRMAQGEGTTKCTKNEVKRSGDTYVMNSVCNVGGSEITSHGTVSGDFSSSYSGNFKSRFNPPLHGRKDSEISLQAKYLGDCKPDQKPGDIIMANGMKMNLAQLGAAAQAAQRTAHK